MVTSNNIVANGQNVLIGYMGVGLVLGGNDIAANSEMSVDGGVSETCTGFDD